MPTSEPRSPDRRSARHPRTQDDLSQVELLWVIGTPIVAVFLPVPRVADSESDPRPSAAWFVGSALALPVAVMLGVGTPGALGL